MDFVVGLVGFARARSLRNKSLREAPTAASNLITVEMSCKYWKHHFALVNYLKSPVAWPEEIMKFIDDQVLAVGKQNSELFYPPGVHPHGDPLGTGSLAL